MCKGFRADERIPRACAEVQQSFVKPFTYLQINTVYTLERKQKLTSFYSEVSEVIVFVIECIRENRRSVEVIKGFKNCIL